MTNILDWRVYITTKRLGQILHAQQMKKPPPLECKQEFNSNILPLQIAMTGRAKSNQNWIFRGEEKWRNFLLMEQLKWLSKRNNKYKKKKKIKHWSDHIHPSFTNPLNYPPDIQCFIMVSNCIFWGIYHQHIYMYTSLFSTNHTSPQSNQFIPSLSLSLSFSRSLPLLVDFI